MCIEMFPSDLYYCIADLLRRNSIIPGSNRITKELFFFFKELRLSGACC